MPPEIVPEIPEASPFEGEIPDFSDYEGNFDAAPWGGEVAIRQWGEQLVAVELPTRNLKDAITKLRHDEGDVFVRLSDDGDDREPWYFERDDDGKVIRIRAHSSPVTRID